MEKFTRAENGYNIDEVNNFVDSVIKNTESMVNRVKFQNNRIIELEKELQVYRNIENAMKNTLIETAKVSANIKETTNRERETIISDAKVEARQIVNEALLRAEKIEFRSDTLERNIIILKRKLKLILDQQQNIVDDIDNLNLE